MKAHPSREKGRRDEHLAAQGPEDDVKASYDHGILTVSVGLKAEKKDEVKKIEVKPAK